MSNIVEILYSKSTRYPQISINGEKISRYMELADLIFDDIFNWADKLYESMDDELCEQYTLQLTGHTFHYRVLKALQPRSEHCAAIRFTPIEYKIPTADKMDYAQELNNRYRLGVQRKADHIRFATDDPARFGALVPCADEPGNYFITAGTQLPDRSCKYCVMLSEKLRFEKMRGVSILHVPEHLLPELVDYLDLYHLHLDFISAVFSAAGDLTMSQEETLKYEAYVHEEYRIHLGALPETMDTGDRFQLAYVYYPQQFGDPVITASTSHPGILFISNNTLIAQSAGTAHVALTDKFGTCHGTFQIGVVHHNYVSNISIVLPATSLRINEALRFKCLISPNDAEDLDSVRYTISDNTVAAFSAQNEIYGLTAGRVKVTVSTARVSRSVYLTVLPKAQDVVLPEATLTMPVNAEASIQCSVVPYNASPMPEASWFSSNPAVVKVEKFQKHTCQIVSVAPGTATLTCSLDGTQITKSMRVTVEKVKGCYVATAVYGSYDCPQVWILRRYRDQFLSSRRWGRAFIKVYYALSPTAVKLFGKTRWFNRLWRGVLDSKIRKLKAHGYRDTPYND